MPARNNINVGDKFGLLTVLKEVEPNITPCGTVQRKFECKCDCGNIVTRMRSSLFRNINPSCGCAIDHYIKYTESQRNSFLYSTWNGMKQRCYDKNSSHYHCYGAKGVRLCDEWLNDYIKFYEWSLANGAKKGFTIDRIYNNGIYEPNNCRWVDIIVQQNNTSKNRWIEYNGEKHTVMQWSRSTGINEATIRLRLDTYGYSIGEALGFIKHKTKKVDKSKYRKKILQYSLDGKFIKEYSCVNEASEKTNTSIKSIRSCATGFFKSGNGFIWKYKEN